MRPRREAYGALSCVVRGRRALPSVCPPLGSRRGEPRVRRIPRPSIPTPGRSRGVQEQPAPTARGAFDSLRRGGGRLAMNRAYKVDREAHTARRRKKRTVEREAALQCNGERIAEVAAVERSDERAELAAVVAEMSRAFKGAVDFYKAEHGGGFSHAAALDETEKMQEHRRESVALVDEMPCAEGRWSVL